MTVANKKRSTAHSTQRPSLPNTVKAFRCPQTVAALAAQIHALASQPWVIMEVCGGQTNTIVRYGLDQLLAPSVQFIHGPGCPVCVTPENAIAQAIALAQRPKTMLCSFGDMLRVPTGNDSAQHTLLTAKANGASVHPIYSPQEAVDLAQNHPDHTIVLLAIGFETTTPATALAALSAHAKGLTNFFMLVSHVTVPAALDTLIAAPDHTIDAFLAAGHVCTVMGTQAYEAIAARGELPIVITGFEPVDLLRGVLAAVHQLEHGDYRVENQYPRYVSNAGNTPAQNIINTVYQSHDQAWRGLGTIPNSGWQLRPDFERLDARQLLAPHDATAAKAPRQNHTTPVCQAGAVLTGKLKPCDCPYFGTRCQPKHPLGAPMVSDEGACAAYFHHRGTQQTHHPMDRAANRPNIGTSASKTIASKTTVSNTITPKTDTATEVEHD